MCTSLLRHNIYLVMCISCTKIKCTANESLHAYILIKPPCSSRHREVLNTVEVPSCVLLFNMQPRGNAGSHVYRHEWIMLILKLHTSYEWSMTKPSSLPATERSFPDVDFQGSSQDRQLPCEWNQSDATGCLQCVVSFAQHNLCETHPDGWM